MAEYKKKKRGVFETPSRTRKKPRKKSDDFERIEMKPMKSRRNSQPTEDLRVVKGRKRERARKTKIYLTLVSALVIAAMLLQVLLPGGVFATLYRSFSLIGGGSYPYSLSSTETVNTVFAGSYYYVLSNTNLDAFTNSGKHLFCYTHGFENPVIKASAYGALVYNQGGNDLLFFNLKGIVKTLKTEEGIITAEVADSGHYAIATFSNEYASRVNVYNKKHRSVYEWYSADDTVNSMAFAPNGRKIAIASFNSENGQYAANLRVLDYKSANPLFTKSYEDGIIYSLENSFRGSFAVVGKSKIEFISWRKYQVTEYKNDYLTAIFKRGRNGYVAVFNRKNDKTDNRIAVFSKSGKLLAEINFKGTVTDIGMWNNQIYCLSDTEILLLDSKGEVLRKNTCGFGFVSMCVTSSNSVVIISDNKIESVNLEKNS